MQSTHTLSHFLDKQRFFDERVQHKLLVYKLLNKKQKKIIIIETVKLFYDIKKTQYASFHTDTICKLNLQSHQLNNNYTNQSHS